MWKYYVLLFVALVLVLAYTYIADPCNRLLRTDFEQRNPSYALLDSRAVSGSPEAVRCRVSYRKPDDKETYEDVWVYRYQGTRWEFSKVAEAEKTGQTAQ